MKPTAVILTVTLFVVVSCNTRDKNEPITIGENVLPKIPLKEEKAVPLPQPDSTKAAKVKIRESKIHTFVHKGEVTQCKTLPPPPEDVYNDSIVFSKVEIEAEYPGGQAAWQRYINRNLHLPQEIIDSELPPSVVVQFVVDKGGNVTNVEAVSGEQAMCAEVIRLIKNSGKWTPAMQNGRKVRSLKKQPVIICLASEG